MKRGSFISPGKRVRPIITRPSAFTATTPLSDFIVPPSDPRGRSSTIHTAVSPSYTRLAEMVLKSEKLPFKTSQDVYRFCIHHGLVLLMGMVDDKDMKTEWNQLKSWERAAATELEMLYFIDHLDKTKERIEQLLVAGHRERALVLAEDVWHQSDRIETPYWQKKFRKMGKDLFDTIKKKAKGLGPVRIRSRSDDDEEDED